MRVISKESSWETRIEWSSLIKLGQLLGSQVDLERLTVRDYQALLSVRLTSMLVLR
jgi:hypothetical protein